MPSKVERFEDELINTAVNKIFNGEAIIQLNHNGNRSVECNFAWPRSFNLKAPICAALTVKYMSRICLDVVNFFELMAKHRFKEHIFFGNVCVN